jgi:nucleoside-diphosphate-sugar epimerase
VKPLPPVSRLDLDHILDHTRDLWDELRGQRIFITGGTGFFGCWLLGSFIWAVEQLGLDTQAFVLTRSPYAFQQKAPHLARHRSITLLQGDVRNFEFPTGTFRYVIHAATESSAKLNAENPLLMLDTIVQGTRHTLDFAKTRGVRKFLLTSSGAIYGRQPSNLTHIPEDYPGAPDPHDPKSAYGMGKRMAEHLCALYSRESNIEMKIARCFAFVGPYLPLDIHFAIGNFIRDALNGGPIIIKGDGTPRRSYLYAADLVIWLWTALFRGRALHPYNIGSDKSLSIFETAEHVAKQFVPNTKIAIKFKPDSTKQPECYIPNITRAKKDLRARIWIDTSEAIRRTIKWKLAY